MTIREAVELYNQVHDKISAIKKMAKEIASQNCGCFRNPSGYIEVAPLQMEQIGKWLEEYSKFLESRLEDDFGKDDE